MYGSTRLSWADLRIVGANLQPGVEQTVDFVCTNQPNKRTNQQRRVQQLPFTGSVLSGGNGDVSAKGLLKAMSVLKYTHKHTPVPILTQFLVTHVPKCLRDDVTCNRNM